MFLKEYRFVVILFSFFACIFGLTGYIFIFKDPSETNLGVTMLSNGIVVPTHNFFATQGWIRTLLGSIFLFLALFFGLGSIVFISQYINLKTRS